MRSNMGRLTKRDLLLVSTEEIVDDTIKRTDYTDYSTEELLEKVAHVVAHKVIEI